MKHILLLTSLIFFFLQAMQSQNPEKHILDSLNARLKIANNDSIREQLIYEKAKHTKDYKEFIAYINEAYAIGNRINYKKSLDQAYSIIDVRLKTAESDTEKVMLYYELGLSTQDTTVYFKCMNEGIALATKIKYEHGRAEGLSKLGWYLMNLYGLPAHHRVVALYDSALKIATVAGDQKAIAQTYHYLGEIHRFHGYYANALEYYNRGNEVAKQLGDSAQLLLNFHDLGWMRVSMKNYPEAINYLSEGYKYAIAIKDFPMAADLNLHMGEAYWSAGNYDSSIFYSSKAFHSFEGLNNTMEMINALNQIGWVRESQKQWKAAEESYRKALSLWTPFEGMAPSYAGLGDALFGQKKYKEALENYLLAVKYFMNSPVSQYKRDAYHGLSESYAQLREFQKAYEAQLAFKIISDSVAKSESSERLTATQAQLDYDKKQVELKAEQQKKDALQRAELSTQKQLKYFFIAGGFLLLIIAFGLVHRLRFTRRSQKQLEEKNKIIAAEKDRAEQSEKFKQQFLANMSHEIRTPMNAVMGMTNLLIENSPRNDQFNYLDGIKNSSATLLHIINDILDVSKIEAGKIELEQIDFSIHEVVGQVKQTLHHKADEGGIQLITDVDADIPDVVTGDPVRLNQVLMNLTGNAIKFTEKGSVLIEVKKGETGIKFSIIDTGVGIPKDKLQRVFESFTQAHSSDTRRFGGTGLGLSISKQLVELMGGSISIESEPGAGSIFSFEINYPVGSAERMRQQKYSEQIDGSILNGLKILLTDDNEYNRVVAHDTLKSKANVEIFEAVNGEDAIEKLSQNDFDVVLMDVQMPVMDGFEATRYIREKFNAPKNEIPIIALTASVIRSDLDKCRQAGMNDYVSKPFKASQLISAIAKATGRAIKFLDEKQIGKGNKTETGKCIIDLSYLEEFCVGDKVRMKKYINIFLESVPVLTGEINGALKENNFEDIANQIHGFKTKWIMMGMNDSKELAQIIELQCRKEIVDQPTVKKNISLLLYQVHTAMEELKQS